MTHASMVRNLNNWFVGLILSLVLAAPIVGHARHSSHNDWDQSWDEHPHVTLYDDCDFEGHTKSVVAGNYRKVTDAGVPNDRISSIEIPDGMEVTIYQDRFFKGKSRTIRSDVDCLTGFWSDQVSSMKIRDTGHGGHNYDSEGDDWGNSSNDCVPYRVIAKGGDGGFRFTDKPKDFKRIQGHEVRGQVCRSGSAQVELSKTDRHTTVVLLIGDDKYVFQGGDPGDKLSHHWYRKYIKVRLN